MTTGTRLDRADLLRPETYVGGLAVTPSDANELATYSNALWIGGAGSGHLKVTTIDGSVIAFASVGANVLIPIACKLVWSTGTDVTAIVALY